jgi:hypothetical protein
LAAGQGGGSSTPCFGSACLDLIRRYVSAP